MKNIYLQDSYLKEIKTEIKKIEKIKKKPAISLYENIFYPGGGGQPPDFGIVKLTNGKSIDVVRILKQNNNIFACLAQNDDIIEGSEIIAKINWERRYNFMRYHTAAHLIMGSIKRSISDYSPNGIEISSDGSICELKFQGEWTQTLQEAEKILNIANKLAAENRMVSIQEYDTLQDAIDDNLSIYRGPKILNGPVRVVVISDWDANPCGGTHVNSLSEIGSFHIETFGKDYLTFSIDQN
ncbi:MAG: alanyl-tRNA editing protein [Bacteriovorax sp.]|nr:alanyl-tRNA editing protein [Bacteriovorax sp.]